LLASFGETRRSALGAKAVVTLLPDGPESVRIVLPVFVPIVQGGKCMRRLLTYTTAMLVALAGTVAVAQKATNPGELEAAMKRVSAANAGVGKGIKSEAYADAKTSVAAVKAALMDAENFWVVNKKDDAVKMSKEAIAKVTALETILSAPTVDQQAAFAAAKEVGGTCAACHKEYRVQNEDKTYSLKPGVI
jgi:cytochrome c556